MTSSLRFTRTTGLKYNELDIEEINFSFALVNKISNCVAVTPLFKQENLFLLVCLISGV